MAISKSMLGNANAGEREEKWPKSVEDVRVAMSTMDKTYTTRFSEWVRSENNVSYICTFKKELFNEFLKEDVIIVCNAIRWLTADWGVASVAELLLKLFYPYRIESRIFANIVQAISVDWSRTRQLDLFNILLIGENASTMAQFFFHITEGISLGEQYPDYPKIPWMLHDKIDFLQSCSNTLRWTSSFSEEFLINITNLAVSNEKSRIRINADIRDILTHFTSDPSKLRQMSA
ncbi:hypothetical protein HDU67_007766 [Dinochytrium kinnereticum]|nr:hypothetical protein HDU67_007766 [Dinochytrium kinnereticum]